MTTLTAPSGGIKNAAGDLAAGTLIVWALEPRESKDGTGLIDTRRHQITITNGTFSSVTLDPGPVNLALATSGAAKTFRGVTVPDQESVSLDDLLVDSYVYVPAVQSAVASSASAAQAAAAAAAASAASAAASAAAAAAAGGGGGDIRHVTVTTGTETRPTAPVVIWIGGDTEPTNMADGDIWLKTAAVADTTAPSMPTGLASSAITDTGFTLTWTAATDNVGVTGYRLLIDGSEYATPAGTSQVVTGRNASTTYQVTVQARDAAGNWSTASTALPVTTGASSDVTLPSVPTGLVSSAVTATGFTLTWSAATDDTGVTGYQVRLDAGTPIDTTALTYNFTGLTASTAYSADVRARDGAGNWSAWSTALPVSTSAAGTTFSIFNGATPPGTYTSYTDGGGSIKVAEAFYYTAGVPLQLVGARLWLPTGLDASFYANVTLFAEARDHPAGGTTPSPDWPTMTHTKTLTTLTPGWNDVTFDSPLAFSALDVDVPDYVWVGYAYAGGNNYLHSPSNTGGLTDAAIESTSHSGLFLAEKTFERSMNSFASGTGASYGIDAIFEAA